jgi:hypothetical protein
MKKLALSRLDRGVAVGLAMIFMAAGTVGLIAVGAGFRRLLILVGLASIWWGCVWMRVALKDRRLQFGELLWPFFWR